MLAGCDGLVILWLPVYAVIIVHNFVFKIKYDDEYEVGNLK